MGLVTHASKKKAGLRVKSKKASTKEKKEESIKTMVVPSGDLVDFSEKHIGELLLTKGGITPVLEEIEKISKSCFVTVKTEQGRNDMKSLAYKIARSKTFIDGVGKDITAEWQKKVRAVNAERSYAKKFLDDLKKEIRRPLTEWEESNNPKEEVVTEKSATPKPDVSPQKKAATKKKIIEGLEHHAGLNKETATVVYEAILNGSIPQLSINY